MNLNFIVTFTFNLNLVVIIIIIVILAFIFVVTFIVIIIVVVVVTFTFIFKFFFFFIVVVVVIIAIINNDSLVGLYLLNCRFLFFFFLLWIRRIFTVNIYNNFGSWPWNFTCLSDCIINGLLSFRTRITFIGWLWVNCDDCRLLFSNVFSFRLCFLLLLFFSNSNSSSSSKRSRSDFFCIINFFISKIHIDYITNFIFFD